MRVGAVLTRLGAALLLAGCKAAAPVPEVTGENGGAECAAVPEVAPGGRVTDAAHILTEADEDRLSARLAEYESRTQHQMVVLTSGLGGAPIDTFATCTGNRWKIGRKGEDDGILILVAPNERQMRIATGLGMEKQLTDAKAAKVIAEMTPHFRERDYAGGIDTAISSIMAQTGTGR